jgi:hypothetical protein
MLPLCMRGLGTMFLASIMDLNYQSFMRDNFKHNICHRAHSADNILP